MRLQRLLIAASLCSGTFLFNCVPAQEIAGLPKRIAYFREYSDPRAGNKIFTVQIVTNKAFIVKYGSIESDLNIPSGTRRFASNSVPDENMTEAISVLADIGIERLKSADISDFKTADKSALNRLIVVDSGLKRYVLHPDYQTDDSRIRLFLELEKNVAIFLSYYAYEVTAK